VKYALYVEKTRNSYPILGSELKGKQQIGELMADGRNILRNLSVMMCTVIF